MPYFKFTIKVADPLRDNLIRHLMKRGCLGLEERNEFIISYFPPSQDIHSISNELSVFEALIRKSSGDCDINIEQSEIPEEDWNLTWKRQTVPVDIGDHITILPPWEQRKVGRKNILINPAMAFGTGHHGTTRSCIVLMEKYKEHVQQDSFLDMGTGTGILALVARLLGFRRVVGIDTDPLAIEAAIENRRLNGLNDVTIRECSIESLDSSYDFIAANLISGVLVSLAAQIAGHLKRDGIAILSGILKGQEREVMAAMSAANLKFVEKHHDEKWISLVFMR
jgi:ribosomal protein L11 methyltransferase